MNMSLKQKMLETLSLVLNLCFALLVLLWVFFFVAVISPNGISLQNFIYRIEKSISYIQLGFFVPVYFLIIFVWLTEHNFLWKKFLSGILRIVLSIFFVFTHTVFFHITENGFSFTF